MKVGVGWGTRHYSHQRCYCLSDTASVSGHPSIHIMQCQVHSPKPIKQGAYNKITCTEFDRYGVHVCEHVSSYFSKILCKMLNDNSVCVFTNGLKLLAVFRLIAPTNNTLQMIIHRCRQLNLEFIRSQHCCWQYSLLADSLSNALLSLLPIKIRPVDQLDLGSLKFILVSMAIPENELTWCDGSTLYSIDLWRIQKPCMPIFQYRHLMG